MRKHIRMISLFLAVLLLAFAFSGCSGKKEAAIKTGIIGAMDEEVKTLKEALQNPKTTRIAGMEFF